MYCSHPSNALLPVVSEMNRSVDCYFGYEIVSCEPPGT